MILGVGARSTVPLLELAAAASAGLVLAGRASPPPASPPAAALPSAAPPPAALPPAGPSSARLPLAGRPSASAVGLPRAGRLRAGSPPVGRQTASFLPAPGGRFAAVATIERRRAVVGPLAELLGLPLILFTEAELAEMSTPHTVRSTGAPSVAEAAALRAAGPGAQLLVSKTAFAAVTVAIAR